MTLYPRILGYWYPVLGYPGTKSGVLIFGIHHKLYAYNCSGITHCTILYSFHSVKMIYCKIYDDMGKAAPWYA